jgi:site-specific recombinase XerD
METGISAFLASLEADAEYSDSTRMAYANDLRVFLLFLQNTLPQAPQISDLNTQRVAAFIEGERKLGRQRNTLIRRLATLKCFSEYLVHEGMLPSDSLSVNDGDIQRVIYAVPASSPLQCLNQEQIESLLKIMEASSRPRGIRDRAIFFLLLETGLSVGDLTDLDMSDLDLRAGLLRVNLVEEGDVWLSMGDAKNAVDDYLSQGRPEILHDPGEPALFISQMDGRLSRQGVWQILNHWGHMANPPIALSPRILRHTAALRMSLNGYPVKEIQSRLRHRNPLSTRALIRRLQAVCEDDYQSSAV